MKKLMIAAGVATAFVLSAGAAMAEGDAEKGAAYAKKKCKSCHTFEVGGKNKVGPNLGGVLTRPAGSAEKYKYSKGFKAAVAAGLDWNDTATLDAYLENPTKLLRKVAGDKKAKSKMSQKTKKEGDRANLIAYLKTL